MNRLLVVLALLAANSAGAADLVAVYQRALQNDPQLREAEATRLAALEAKPQALSYLLPHLSGTGLVSRERDTGSQNTTQAVTLPPCNVTPPGVPCAKTGDPPTVLETFPFGGKIETTVHHYTVDLRQSLFRWENWEALKRADSQVEARARLAAMTAAAVLSWAARASSTSVMAMRPIWYLASA